MGHADNKFTVTTDIRNILSENEAIHSLIGDKIFPLIAPVGTVGDFIVYQRDSYQRERGKMGVIEDVCRVYINVVSDDYDRSQHLAQLVDEALDAKFENPSMDIILKDSAEDYTDGKFIQVLLFEIN